jgi:small subunit ribosomal protein S20
MPNIKSAKKRLKQSIKRRERNRAAKATLKTTVKKAETALDAGNKEEASKAIKAAVKRLDKTAQKGVIHKKAASRKKSRLMTKLNKISS